MTYTKDGIRSECKTIVSGGRFIFNPTHEEIISAGWEVYVPAAVELTNEDIRKERALAYGMRSDSLYMAYLKYTELGEPEKAALSKTDWLNEIAAIDAEYPYIKDNE